MPKINKYSWFVIVSFMFFNIGCKNDETNQSSELKDLSSLEWIIGTWEGLYNENKIVEVWEKKSPTAFKGYSYYIINNDTNHIEKLSIEILDNEIYYSADVPHNKSIVSFKMILSKKHEAIFENKNHDYPSRISYVFQQPDNLSAKIWGHYNNEIKEDEFYYKKVNK